MSDLRDCPKCDGPLRPDRITGFECFDCGAYYSEDEVEALPASDKPITVTARESALVAMLKRLEWGTDREDPEYDMCMICGGISPFESQDGRQIGHYPGCAIASLLRSEP